MLSSVPPIPQHRLPARQADPSEPGAARLLPDAAARVRANSAGAAHPVVRQQLLARAALHPVQAQAVLHVRRLLSADGSHITGSRVASVRVFRVVQRIVVHVDVVADVVVSAIVWRRRARRCDVPRSAAATVCHPRQHLSGRHPDGMMPPPVARSIDGSGMFVAHVSEWFY